MTYRTILFCIIALFPLEIDAQQTKIINAVIEDDKFLCILKSIDFYPDSTVATWKLKSKTRTCKFKLSEHISIKEIESGIKHKQINTFEDLQETIRFKNRYDIKEFKTYFPAINDSALISIYLSPTIYVDSLKLKSENLFYEVYKFRVPVYNHQPLRTRVDSIKYSDELYLEGLNLFKNGNYQLAIISFEKSMAIERQIRTWDEYWHLGDNFNEDMWIAYCYYKLGEMKEAEEYSSTYYVEPYNKKIREKADSLSIMSDTIYNQSKLNVLNEICVLDSLYIGGTSFRFAESLYNLGCQYLTMREFQDAKHIFEKAKNIIAERYNKKNRLISLIYRKLAELSFNENDVVSAIRYMEKGLDIESDTIIIKEEIPSLSDYEKLAYYYKAAGDWDKGLEIISKWEKYWRELYYKDPHKSIAPLGPGSAWYDNQYAYCEMLSSYASFLSAAGLNKQALRKYKESLNVKKGCLNWSEFEDLGKYNYILRDFDNALLYYKKSAQDYLSALNYNSKHDITYLRIQNAIANTYSRKGDMENAISIQKENINNALIEVQKNDSLFGKWAAGYDDYADYVSNLARYYNLDQQYDNAIVFEKKSLDIKKIYCPTNYNLAYSYMNLGYSYAGKKMWNEALKYSLQAYNTYYNNEDREFYLRSLTDLSNCYFHLYRYTDLEKSIYEMMEVAGHALYSTIQELTYDERSRFVDEYSDLMNQKIPMYAYYTCSDSIIEESYNASLIMKGALLNSENSVKRVIDDSEDKSLKSMWDEMKSDRYILSKELQRDSLERKLNVDSLQKVIYNLEDTLILKCKEYGDITQSMKLKWQDVQRTLHPEDVAIEFLSFPINNDSVMYVALTLRKEKSPRMITLFEEKQLKNVSDTLYYQCKAMTDLIWCPLLPELKGIKNIYFSPTSALYNIGIEYLPGMEDYNIYRLSSTRELVNRRDINENNRAVLYGGLDYDAKLDTFSQSRSRTRFSEKFVDHSDVRSMKYRGGQENLTHTLDEVEQIEKELKKTQWQCLLDTLSLGTEESFKSLSGKKINTLHIATHGFYYTLEESDNIGYDFLLLNDQTSTEDRSLSRSGLLMSGANHILDGDSIPENVEDGILTAKEIADVDLRGLDLVVLSACQTGLGDISQGEGVFGLQRGFKKAGANSILMSLWEVNDEATQILMTQFYKNLVSGQSKRQSLRSAQKYLREYNRGKFDKPEYWAAFILLDGLEKNQGYQK
jgi:CHAT domain-containing protein